MKYETISLEYLRAIYHVAIATVIFSHVQVTCHFCCFWSKAHLVFHCCL